MNFAWESRARYSQANGKNEGMSKVKGEPRTKQNALHLTSLPKVGEKPFKTTF